MEKGESEVPKISPKRAKDILINKGFLPEDWNDYLKKKGQASFGYHEIQGLINIAMGEESMTMGEAYKRAREVNGLSKNRGWGRDNEKPE